MALLSRIEEEVGRECDIASVMHYGCDRGKIMNEVALASLLPYHLVFLFVSIIRIFMLLSSSEKYVTVSSKQNAKKVLTIGTSSRAFLPKIREIQN